MFQNKKNIILLVIVILGLTIWLVLSLVLEKSSPANVISPEDLPENAPQVFAGGAEFVDPDRSFSFSYDELFVVSRLPVDLEDPGETFIFKGEDEKENFQIYVSIFDDDLPLSVGRIQNELPNMDFRDSQMISIDGAVAVVFSSSVGTLETREIWFTHDGKLYQISTYPEFDQKMVEILERWKWISVE